MTKERILIVDDEPDIVQNLKFILEKRDHKVLTAYNGLEALKKAQNERPDLILLDLMLPKMDGYKVCRLLKFDERYKHIPIIMLTARTQESDKSLGEETGADRYVTKPFDTKELLTIIKELLEKSGK